LVCPAAFIVDTQAIGRGTTASRKNTYISDGLKSATAIDTLAVSSNAATGSAG
jgi:hypothetical protein